MGRGRTVVRVTTFSHDGNERNSLVVTLIREKYGIEGYAVYFMLKEVFSGGEGYKIPLALISALDEDFKSHSGLSLSVVEELQSEGIITKAGKGVLAWASLSKELDSEMLRKQRNATKVAKSRDKKRKEAHDTVNSAKQENLFTEPTVKTHEEHWIQKFIKEKDLTLVMQLPKQLTYKGAVNIEAEYPDKDFVKRILYAMNNRPNLLEKNTDVASCFLLWARNDFEKEKDKNSVASNPPRKINQVGR